MEKKGTDYVFNVYESDSKKSREGTQRLIKRITELLIESDYKEIDQLLSVCLMMRYQLQGYLEDSPVNEEEKNKLVNVGYTRALIDMMQMYKEKVSIQYEIQRVNTKYRDILLRILADRGTLLHKDLAIALGVSASGLTAIIKQINSTSVKLVNVEEFSKYKMYSITAVALKYINSNREINRIKEAGDATFGRLWQYYFYHWLDNDDADKRIELYREKIYRNEGKETAITLYDTNPKFEKRGEFAEDKLVNFAKFKQKRA